MSFKKSFGKTIVLLLIILILVVGGLFLFDRLGLINFKSFANIFVKNPQTSITATQSKPLVANLDEDRLGKRREALEIWQQELEKREDDLETAEKLNAEVSAELVEREKNQEEREKTFNQTVKKYDDKNINVEQIAKNLNGMRPEDAVAILSSMDDQTIIDVLRKVEELAAASGSASMGSYWLSLMDPKRAAEVQRKMLSKPTSLE